MMEFKRERSRASGQRQTPLGTGWFGVCAVAVALVTAASAGIPQPDTIFYGSVTINGQVITATDDVTIVARVTGVPNPVGLYKMGQGALAEDNYVLRVRLEASVPDSPAGDNAAQVGQTAQILVRLGTGPENFVQEVALSSIGLLQRLDLNASILPANCVADTNVDLADHRSFRDCIGGPGEDAPPICACADVDGDGHVDLKDWRWLQRGFTGTKP